MYCSCKKKSIILLETGFKKIHPWEQLEFNRAVWWAGRMQDYLFFNFSFFLSSSPYYLSIPCVAKKRRAIATIGVSWRF